MGARVYDPQIGRFLSVDPLLVAFPSHSPYSYSFNNPISYTDPSGLAPEKEKGGGNKIQIHMFQFEKCYEEWTIHCYQTNMSCNRTIYMIDGMTVDKELFMSITLFAFDADNIRGGYGLNTNGGGGRLGTISLSNNPQIVISGLSKKQVSFLENVINTSEYLYKQWTNILQFLSKDSKNRIILGIVAGYLSQVSDDGKNTINFNIAEEFFNIDINSHGGMAGAIQQLGHETSHILGRFTGERIADNQLIIIAGEKIEAEELRAQQHGNQALREYLNSNGENIANESDYNYRLRTKNIDIKPYYFPGSYDFSKFKKSKKIGG